MEGVGSILCNVHVAIGVMNLFRLINMLLVQSMFKINPAKYDLCLDWTPLNMHINHFNMF